jgi:hypothetical protein
VNPSKLYYVCLLSIERMPPTDKEQKCIDCGWTGYDVQVCQECGGSLIEA